MFAKLNKWLAMGLFSGMCVGVAPAEAVLFDITSVTFTPGSGYGVDSGANAENGGDLLDVLFTSAFSSITFNLDDIGDVSDPFQIGTVNFREPNTGNGANIGIRSQETDDLDVTVLMTFADPLGMIQRVLATGQATTGTIADAGVDFLLNWDPVLVDFGTGGQFQIDFLDLSFSGVGQQAQNATIKLLALPTQALSLEVPAAGAVPEPAALSLLGLGMVGMLAARRSRRR